jgi:hypothetical protein
VTEETDGTGAPEEGWFEDPYGIHHDRWVSAGRPTKLVRDDGIETYDEPPAGAVPRPFTPVRAASAAGGNGDLRRADEAQHGNSNNGDPKRFSDAAWSAIGGVFPVN